VRLRGDKSALASAYSKSQLRIERSGRVSVRAEAVRFGLTFRANARPGASERFGFCRVSGHQKLALRFDARTGAGLTAHVAAVVIRAAVTWTVVVIERPHAGLMSVVVYGDDCTVGRIARNALGGEGWG
jgi:hypothetical protein